MPHQNTIIPETKPNSSKFGITLYLDRINIVNSIRNMAVDIIPKYLKNLNSACMCNIFKCVNSPSNGCIILKKITFNFDLYILLVK